MKLHASKVGLIDHPFYEIIFGIGSLSFFPCQKTGPWGIFRIIERIPCSPYLYYSRIEVEIFVEIQDFKIICLLFINGIVPILWPVDVNHSGHPDASKFGLWLLNWLEDATRSEKQEEGKEAVFSDHCGNKKAYLH